MIASAYRVPGIEMVSAIESDEQNKQYVSEIRDLERQSDLSAEKKAYKKALITLVAAYEQKRYSIEPSSPVEILQYLMEVNNLKQKDLAPYLGSEVTVSKVLRGTRDLTKNHIAKLSERFKVEPGLFFERSARA